MSALVIDQLTSKSEINDHTHLSRYKLTEQNPVNQSVRLDVTEKNAEKENEQAQPPSWSSVVQPDFLTRS